MRIAPAGLWFSENYSDAVNIGRSDPWLIAEDKDERREAEQLFFSLMRLAHDLGFITHQGSTALSCGVLQAYMTHKFYRFHETPMSPEDWTESVWKELCHAAELLVEILGCGSELVAMLRSAKTKGEWQIHSNIIAGIGSGFTAIQSCTIAWITAIMNADDLRSGILAAVNAGGDADTVGAMTGALLGVKFGLSGIPENFVSGLDRHEEIAALANKLFETTAREA
jgi:ADP-ribosylglycohydrolase